MANHKDIEKKETAALQRAERTRSGRTFMPSVDIVERGDELLLMADLPGVASNDLDIRYERGELTLFGRVRPRQQPQQNYVLREYGVGDFYRAFQVGEDVDASKIEAELKEGVLTLRLPKTARAIPRKIPVKTP